MRRTIRKPFLYMYSVEVTPQTGGAKADVKFTGHVDMSCGYKINKLQFVYTTKDGTELIIDDAPNPALVPKDITSTSTQGVFTYSMRGMPAGRFTRGLFYAEFLGENGKIIRRHTIEKRGSF